MHGHHPETHNYRPACARTGLAAPRRPSLVIQKIHRLGVGAANNWLGRAMDEKPSNPTSTKMVAMQVRGTSRNLTGAAVCHSPISIAGSSTSKLRPSDARRPTTGWGWSNLWRDGIRTAAELNTKSHYAKAASACTSSRIFLRLGDGQISRRHFVVECYRNDL
jgi:hypothetical protein